jgi:hypothetical protein
MYLKQKAEAEEWIYLVQDRVSLRALKALKVRLHERPEIP